MIFFLTAPRNKYALHFFILLCSCIGKSTIDYFQNFPKNIFWPFGGSFHFIWDVCLAKLTLLLFCTRRLNKLLNSNYDFRCHPKKKQGKYRHKFGNMRIVLANNVVNKLFNIMHFCFKNIAIREKNNESVY